MKSESQKRDPVIVNVWTCLDLFGFSEKLNYNDFSSQENYGFPDYKSYQKSVIRPGYPVVCVSPCEPIHFLYKDLKEICTENRLKNENMLKDKYIEKK